MDLLCVTQTACILSPLVADWKPKKEGEAQGPAVAVKTYRLDSATLLWFSVTPTHRIWNRLRDESLSMSVMACRDRLTEVED